MAKVKNVLRQPLVVNVGGNEAVHFLSKQVKDVQDEYLASEEFQNHISKGNIVVIRIG